MVIIPDRLSQLVEKGELVARYYNPGDLFAEVHLLLINDDQPDPGAVQSAVGSAKLVIHNLPPPSFVRTLGARPWLLGSWAERGVNLARAIDPALIRVHGVWLNGFLGARIKQALGRPLVVSLHTHPVVDGRGQWPGAIGWKYWLVLQMARGLERETIAHADRVAPVYASLVPFVQRLGARHVQVCYNVINPNDAPAKTDYALGDPPRIVSVGRQFGDKNPENLIRAMAGLEATLTLIGDGPLNGRLREIACSTGVADRVSFIKSLPNDQLCAALPGYDLFALHLESFGVSKTLLEAWLAGLPVVINQRRRPPVAELEGDWVELAANSPDGYRSVLQRLLTDHRRREALGRHAREHAMARYHPASTEKIYADIYRSLRP